MSSYPKRVADNILPLSVSGDLSEAFQEWFFTENTEDHEDVIENCQLCNQEQLRYHFEIKNKFTEEILQVGSSCILKFNVTVYDEKHSVLNEKDSKKKLEKLLQKMRLESCIKSLEKLAIIENNNILKNALAYYSKNKYLTPKFAFVVFWKLKEKNIDHTPSFFKVSLKRNKFKEDLKLMDTRRVHLFWKALTSSQKKLAIEYGHHAPK
jgi:hypothetical protein